MTKAQRNILIKAAGIVEKGWCQGAYQKGKRVCAAGAINQASGHPPDSDVGSDFYRKMRDLLGQDVADFNDAPGRKKEEVMQVLLEIAHA